VEYVKLGAEWHHFDCSPPPENLFTSLRDHAIGAAITDFILTIKHPQPNPMNKTLYAQSENVWNLVSRTLMG